MAILATTALGSFSMPEVYAVRACDPQAIIWPLHILYYCSNKFEPMILHPMMFDHRATTVNLSSRSSIYDRIP